MFATIVVFFLISGTISGIISSSAWSILSSATDRLDPIFRPCPSGYSSSIVSGFSLSGEGDYAASSESMPNESTDCSWFDSTIFYAIFVYFLLRSSLVVSTSLFIFIISSKSEFISL